VTRDKVLLSAFLFLLNLSCEKILGPSSSGNEIYITKFDVEAMIKKYLPDFKLVRETARWREGKEFLFENVNGKNSTIFIRVGIHSSKIKAQEIAEEYNSWCWIIPREDSLGTLGIGERSWWMPNVDSPDTVAYHFIRNNTFIITNSHTYPNLLSLTKAIDKDLTNGADYIKKSKSISLPEIKSITTPKAELGEEESTKVTVNAFDPKNEQLEYVCHPGLIHGDNDPENVFTFIASRDYIPEPFWGKHILKFIVVNESNVISEEAESEIIISE